MANAQTATAEDLTRELEELRAKRRGLALDVMEGRANEQELLLVEERLTHVMRTIERRQLADLEQQARAEAEAARERAAKREELAAEVAALEAVSDQDIRAVAEIWEKVEAQLRTLVERRGALLKAAMTLCAFEGSELGISEGKLKGTEGMTKWLTSRLVFLWPYVEVPASRHTWLKMSLREVFPQWRKPGLGGKAKEGDGDG